jgi:hypothetical protein
MEYFTPTPNYIFCNFRPHYPRNKPHFKFTYIDHVQAILDHVVRYLRKYFQGLNLR